VQEFSCHAFAIVALWEKYPYILSLKTEVLCYETDDAE
jgi:hypothetical protein